MSQEVCTRSMVRIKKPEAERASQNQEYQENKRKLGKKPVTKPKNARKIKGTGLGT